MRKAYPVPSCLCSKLIYLKCIFTSLSNSDHYAHLLVTIEEMKKLLFRLTLPLTIVSFITLTKWWHGIVEDGKDVYFYGFPLIHKCEGFHTSLSTQYFLSEMTLNLLIYFIFWLILTFILNQYWKINIPKRLSNMFWIGIGILFLGFIYLSHNLDDRYLQKRNFEVEILDSGFTIFENNSPDRAE